MVARREIEIDQFFGALVFPGGKVDPDDSARQIRQLCRGAQAWDDYQLGLRVAAIRESFEESGVFLARDRTTGELIDAQRMAALGEFREPLDRGEISLSVLLEQEHLDLATDLLVHFAHWVTPEAAPKRYDTHFFAAPVPVDVEPLHCGRETVDCVWEKPGTLLAEADSGKWTIVFPTRCNLAKAALYNSFSALAAATAATPVVTVSPLLVRDGDVLTLRIPESAGYPLNHQVLPPRSRP
jgi:8-oxo-dGTP pyrophosphatase MutT (NUDIX family)